MASGWDQLAQDWSTYGTTPLLVDSQTFCGPAQVTYAALVAAKANVLVLSDPAGAEYTFSSAEIAAITEYVQAGHNIVGTCLTFQYDSTVDQIDNTALAPLFGLTASFAGTSHTVTADYQIRDSESLFRAVSNPYDSSGYPRTQSPSAGRWYLSALNGAKYGARTPGNHAAITIFRNNTYRYQAVYISTMPEFSPNSADEQFLYNALTLRR